MVKKYVPLNDYTDFLKPEYKDALSLRDELKLQGIKINHINWNSITIHEVELFQKQMNQWGYAEKISGFDSEEARNIYFGKIQSYIDWNWGPKRKISSLFLELHKKYKKDGICKEDFEKIFFPLPVYIHYEGTIDPHELYTLVVDFCAGRTHMYPKLDNDPRQYADDFAQELQFTIDEAFDQFTVYNPNELNNLINDLLEKKELKSQELHEQLYHKMQQFCSENIDFAKYIVRLIKKSNKIIPYSRHYILVAALGLTCLIQKQRENNPNGQIEVDTLIKKEIVLDQETQEKITQEISIFENRVKETKQHTHVDHKKETTKAISDTMNVQATSLSEKVVKAVREVFTAPTPLKQTPLKPIQSASTDRERIMSKENIGDYILMKDPIAKIYFRKVKAGQTLGEVHRALQQDERFAYLKDDSYDPSRSGNVFGWNIKSGVLQPGMLVPVPLDRTETIITQKAFISASMEAVDAIKSHPTYGDFVTTLDNNLGRNHLMKMMIVFADKESNMGSTQLHRFEPHHDAYSYSWFHILDEGPGRDALLGLGFTEADVMSDPMKASQWFRAYWYEKFNDLQNNKNFGKRYDNPSKFFAKKNLKTCGKLYNGSASYGTALKNRRKELFE